MELNKSAFNGVSRHSSATVVPARPESATAGIHRYPPPRRAACPTSAASTCVVSCWYTVIRIPQPMPPPSSVSSSSYRTAQFGILLADGMSGPFKFEIQYLRAVRKINPSEFAIMDENR